MSAELQKVWNSRSWSRIATGAGGTIAPIRREARRRRLHPVFAADATNHHRAALYSKLPYDPVRDLAPIVNVAAGPFVLMANPAFPPNT